MSGSFAFQVDVNHDELEASLVVVKTQPGTHSNPDSIVEQLREESVLAGIDREAIKNAVSRLPTFKEPGERIVVARGRSARNGKPGHIDFKIDTSGKATYKADDDSAAAGSVDYRNATKIVQVKPGDLLAEVVPPTPGESGVNLAGKEIQPKPGKAVVLRAGEGVEADEAERYYKATIEGRPVFSLGTISVSPICVIDGDVDYSSGNVDFNGHVEVSGAVQDDFRITSASANIGGTVGACEIKCSGDLAIGGGINGREKARIEVGGNADIKYINQAEVIVHGNLTVQREIINSTIWCMGKVTAGTIVGGECLALGGIDASILGSELGVSTTIEPGANFEVRKIDNHLATIAGHIEKTIKPVRLFFGERGKYKALPQEKRDEYDKAYEQFAKLKDAYIKLLNERQKKLTDTGRQPVKRVDVRKLVYPDVFVRTDLCMKQYSKPLTGPLSLVEDVEGGTLRARNFNAEESEDAKASD